MFEALLCLIAFVAIVFPLTLFKTGKPQNNVYGNSGWRTLKLKKLRNKRKKK